MKLFYNRMRLLTNMLFLLAVCVVTACDSDSDEELQSNFTAKADFPGAARTGAVAFTLDGVAYVGTGSDGGNLLNDFWQYNPTQDAWTRLPDFPGDGRSSAVSFTANGKGYIGTGYNGTGNLQDFWQYDPATQTWAQVADFAGTARYGAVALSLENKGYIGGGYDGSYLKDFWQYDPATDTWTEKNSFSGARRVNGFAFAINGKGYVGGGRNSGILEADILEYSPATDTWRNMKALNTVDQDGTVGKDYPSTRSYASVFVLDNKAYLMGGSGSATPTNSAPYSDVWAYDPLMDDWRLVEDLIRPASRESGIAFGIGNFGYIGLGRSGATRFSNLWQFDITGSGN